MSTGRRLERLGRTVARKHQESGLTGILHAVATRVAARTAGCPSDEPATPLASALTWLARRDSVAIVQVGAYVGNTANDPLCAFLHREFRSGRRAESGSVVVLVEPVKEYFDRLAQNYGDLAGLRFENVAIAERNGARDFYRLAADPVEHGFPAWLSQLGSLSPERMTRMWDSYEKDDRLQQFYLANMVTETVQCCTLDDLLGRHGITDLDLLQIDTEGYDYEILKTIDFAEVRPRFVNYERVLLQAEERECRRVMGDAGYVLVDWGQDTFCIRVD